MLKHAWSALKNRRPLLVSAATTPPTLSQLTLRIPGPVTREYTVINQSLPREPFAHKNKDSNKASCALARIEFFHDETARRLILTEIYSRLKVVDLELNPWPLGGTIFDTNPHIDENHFIVNNCYGLFWVKGYENPTVDTTSGQQGHVLCRLHGYEGVKQWSSVLLMQLGAGLIDLPEWAHSNSHMVDNASATDSGLEVSGDGYQGSHLCHNGDPNNGVCCRNILCMKWESRKDNQARKICHSRFTEDPDDDLGCICAPGLTLPCKNRAKETGKTVRKAFTDRFKAIQSKRDPTNKPMSRFGRYPFPDCGCEIVTISRLLDCFRITTVKALARHMNSMHRRSVRTAIPVLSNLLIR
jgi:hypothetical protein